MATWTLQGTEINMQILTEKQEDHQYLNLDKKFWRVPMFISVAEYVVCCSGGNSHCPSNYVVSCCDMEFKT